MTKKILFSLAVLLTVAVQAQTPKRADAAQAKSMIAKINQTAASIRSMTCNFTQVKTLSFLNDKLTSQGRMCYDSSGRLRWEYLSPYSYVFVLNGQKVYIKSSKSAQTVDIRQSRLFQGIAQVMMNCVTGRSLTSSADFDCVMSTQGAEWVALLTPKKKELKKLFQTVELHFSSSRQMVTRIIMAEPSGDTTVIDLKDVKTNQPVDEKMFVVR